MEFLHCPLPCRFNDDSDTQFNSNHSSDSSSSSYSSSTLYSQTSLPSVPSLTKNDQPTTAHHRCISTLTGHSSYVFSLALAGKHLFSGSSNNEIRIWPTNLSDPVPDSTNVVVSGESAVKSIVVSADKLFTAHQDHKIRVWKIDPHGAGDLFRCVATLPLLCDRFTRSFSAKNYVEIRRHKKCTWVHHVDTVSALALSGDDSLLYSVSWDRTFKVWRTSDFKCLGSVWNAHDDAINAIALSPDGIVYTGSADNRIKVWRRDENGKSHELIGTLEKHKSAINALALSSDGSILYSGACDRSIVVWEKDGGGGDMVVCGALRGHTKAILCLAVVGDLVFSGSADKTVRIWRRGIGRSYSCLAVLEGHRKPVKCLVATVDGNGGESISTSGIRYKVYSGSLDCDIKVWDVCIPLF